MEKLPDQICVLDIETAELIDKKADKELAKLKIAVAGVKVYALHEGTYAPQFFKYYLTQQLTELGAFLGSFPGLVIGHNILEFDYKVLRHHMPLAGIIEKTIDTLYFLCGKNGGVIKGLSLDNLSLMNFDEGKALSGKSVPEMWRNGKCDEVIRYNEIDCELTQKLWWKMVNDRSVAVNCDEDGNCDAITITNEDLPSLTGRKPLFTYAAWDSKMTKDGWLIEKVFTKFERFDYDDFGWEPSTEETESISFYCDDCNKTSLFIGHIVRGCCAYEDAECPQCKKVLGSMREDMHDAPSCIGTIEGDTGGGVFQGMVPTAFEGIMREHLEKTKPEWEISGSEHPQGELRLFDDKCRVCGNPPMEHQELYENPVDGEPICMNCLTACRWLLQVS